MLALPTVRFRPAVLALAVLCAVPALAQSRGGALVRATAPPRANDEPRPSANALVGQTVGTTVITVAYGRPSVRGRLVFGSEADGALVPTGQVWRTGANEATTITLSDSVRVEGRPLGPGTYSLFTVPTDDEWTVVFNRTAQQWGSFRYSAADDALRVTVEPTREAPMQEQFEIRFTDVTESSATMILHWDRTGVPVRFEATGTRSDSGAGAER